MVLDIGDQTLNGLLFFIEKSRHLFILEGFCLDPRSLLSSHSVFRALFRLREARAARHQEESKKGINYRLDTVITLVGDFDETAQKVQLKDKPAKVRAEDEDEEEDKAEEEDEGELVKNINLVQDFYLREGRYVQRLLTGEFVPCLSNVTKYRKSDD